MSVSVPPPLAPEQVLDTSGELALFAEVRRLRDGLGGRAVVLAHHYQRPEIVLLGDHRGDSFELARAAARSEAEFIFFCGVRFMAESAAVLARPGQKVFHPDPGAGCPMADMVDPADLGAAWRALGDLFGPGGVAMVVYMNTPATVKAICGEAGGTVCTSSNAARAFRWAFEQAPRLLFVPDEHLGRNTAEAMGIGPGETALWDPSAGILGGNDPDGLRRSRLILWKGYCHVHTWFRPDHVAEARRRHPGARVVVHPECRREVVAAADGAGSTGYLVRQVAEAAPGATLVVGTEGNLVRRLALEYPDRTVVPLARSICPNMFRITLGHLRDALLRRDAFHEVTVPEEVRKGATAALDRMLALPG